MPPVNGPYQSRFFNFINRHSLRLKNRLEETLRHWRTVAGLGVQALIYPLYWLFHPQRWTGPLLTPGYSEPQLPPQDSVPPWSDQPLRQVLDQMRPWFTTDPAELDLEPIPPPFSPIAITCLQPAQPLILPGQFFESLQRQLAQGQLPRQTEKSLLVPWPQRLKNLVLPCPYPDLVIRGIASRCGDRRLVLATQDNEILDVLSTQQCQNLTKTIQWALASFNQQKRLQWALQQQSWGGIPLVNAETAEPILPLQWLWRGLYWWERGETQEQVQQTLSQIPHLQEGIIHLPQTLPRVVYGLTTQLQQKWPFALTPDRLDVGQLDTGRPLVLSGLDPLRLKALISAAIAYFFGSAPSNPPLPLEPPSLSVAESSSPWLCWQDLGGESPVPISLAPSPPAIEPEAIAPPISHLKPLATAPPPPQSTPKSLPDWDWIDIQSQPLGYHKHPLEIILEFLDHLVLILEEGLRWLWQRVSRLFCLIAKKSS